MFVAYLGLAPDLPAPDQPQMSWQPVSALTRIASDHARVLLTASSRRAPSWSTPRWRPASSRTSSQFQIYGACTGWLRARRSTRATSPARWSYQFFLIRSARSPRRAAVGQPQLLRRGGAVLLESTMPATLAW